MAASVMKLAGGGGRKREEEYFCERMRQIPRMRDHLTQANQLDGSLSTRQQPGKKKETEQSPSHHYNTSLLEL